MIDRDPSRKERSKKATQRLLAVKNVVMTAENIHAQDLEVRARRAPNNPQLDIERAYLKHYLKEIQKAADPMQSITNGEQKISLYDDIEGRYFVTTQLHKKYRIPLEDIDRTVAKAKEKVGLITVVAFSGPTPLCSYSRQLVGLIAGQKLDDILPEAVRLPTKVAGVQIEYVYPAFETKKPQMSVVFEPI